MSQVIDLRELLKPYSDKWVALSKNEDEVVGSGDTPEEALRGALKQGIKNSILTKVPRHYGSYIL